MFAARSGLSTHSRLLLLVFGLTLGAFGVDAGASAVKEEAGDPVVYDAQVRFLPTSLVNDALTGDVDGRIYAESKAGKALVAQRKGYVVDTLETADLGGGNVLVAGWVSGGKARYLIPEVYRVATSGESGVRLVKLWGPFEESPLYEGEVRIEESQGKGRLTLEDSLVSHSFASPHLRRTIQVAWKDGGLAAGPPVYAQPESPHQKANLAYEHYTRGEHKTSLRLYLEAIKELGEALPKDDPELGAALYFAAAANFEKMGEVREQRAFLGKVVDLFPETNFARKAADKLLRLKGAEGKGR